MRGWRLWAFVAGVVCVVAPGIAPLLGVALKRPVGGPLTTDEAPQTAMDVERALRAVRARPADASAWLALGDAQVALDHVEAAEHAYRTAIRLATDGQAGALSRARLGFLLYARGADDEARRWLAEARERGAQVPLLNETLAQLSPPASPPPTRDRRPAVAPSADPAGRRAPDAGFELDAAVPMEAAPVNPTLCAVDLDRRRNGALIVDARIDGVDVALIVDTGATRTVLNRSAAARVGAAFLDRTVRASTANGVVELSLGRVDRVEVGDRAVDGLVVAVCEECIETGPDGLFGVDLQGQLDVRVDVAGARLLFADCVE